MRIPMALSNTTMLAIKEYKKVKYPDIKVTYGYLVKKAFNEIAEDLNIISWEAVNQYERNFLNSVTEKNNGYSTRQKTTLNIEEAIIEELYKLRENFKTIFCSQRIYLPFVLKLIFLAAIMKMNGVLPTLNNQ